MIRRSLHIDKKQKIKFHSYNKYYNHERGDSKNVHPEELIIDRGKDEDHFPASILSWATIGPPAKLHLNGVLLADQLWLTFKCILGYYIIRGLDELMNGYIKVYPKLELRFFAKLKLQMIIYTEQW